MWKSGDTEYRSLVIALDISDKEPDYRTKCEGIISEQLSLAQSDGWQPTISTNFDYLKENGYLCIHEKENSLKTFLYSALALFTLPVTIQDTIYESATIALVREVNNC